MGADGGPVDFIELGEIAAVFEVVGTCIGEGEDPAPMILFGPSNSVIEVSF
jgi:hypothetical protein